MKKKYKKGPVKTVKKHEEIQVSGDTLFDDILTELYVDSGEKSDVHNVLITFRSLNKLNADESVPEKKSDELDDFSDELDYQLNWRSVEESVSNQKEKVSTKKNKKDVNEDGFIPTWSVPEDAPQVIKHDGKLKLIRNKTVYPPLFFFSSVPDENKLQNVLNEIKLATENGVNLFMFLITLEVNTAYVERSSKLSSFLLEKTLEINKKAQVVFRTIFAPPENWKTLYPDSIYQPVTDEPPKPSICDEKFWSDAEKTLELYVKGLMDTPQKNSIMGVHPEYGEWFYSEGQGYDYSASNQKAFREWLKLRYRDSVVSLRAAWFEGKVNFDKVEVPEYQKHHESGVVFARMDRRAKKWVDYHLFLSDAMVKRIRRLCRIIKEASGGMLLAGVNYGYTFDWSHPGSGHLSLGKLLRSPEIDYISGPPSYQNRNLGDSASSPGPIDSFLLNGKLYLLEQDYKTLVSKEIVEPDEFNPVLKKPSALEGVHYRDLGTSAVHGYGTIWMDSWGNGWLNNGSVWKRSATANETYARNYKVELEGVDVIAFIDERSLAYLSDELSFSKLVHETREALLRSGMSVGFYLLSDLAHREHFPEAKFYIFLNAWDLRPEIRMAVKNKLHKDNKLLFWLYTAGLFESGREAIERVREVTGINIKQQPFGSISGSNIVNYSHPISSCLIEEELATGGALHPTFYVSSLEDAEVVAEYKQTGLPSIVVSKQKNVENNSHWTSVFFGESIVNSSLFRTLGAMANVHTWTTDGDAVHINPPLVAIHSKESGNKVIHFPKKLDVYDFLNKKWVSLNTNQYKFESKKGKSYLFYIGEKSKLEKILQEDVLDTLKIESIPEQEENTADIASYNFDVPIMKLDEWMTESSTIDSDEKYILSTTAIEEEDVFWEDGDIVIESNESDDVKNERRGKRRRNSSKDKAKDTFCDSYGMNVMFRKRV